MRTLKKFFSSIILVISLLLLIYTFYKSELIWDGNNREYYKSYYFISLTLISISIISFFLNNILKLYLIISTISLILSLYLFEGYITLKDEYLKYQLYEKETGNIWDKRTPLEIYKDLKIKNEYALYFNPSFVIQKNDQTFLPLSGLSNSKTIHCNENGYYSIYQSDRYGFNNPDEEWDEKEINYLLVGDSFAHGACVNRPNDMSSILRKLSKKSVLNLGTTGNGPLLQYATLKEYLNKNVKKVLWIYYEGNDLNNLFIEKKNNILINYLKDSNFSQNLKLKQNDVDDFVINIIKKKEEENKIDNFKVLKNKIIKFIKIFNIRNLIFQKKLPAQQSQLLEFKEILHLTKELTNKNNSKLYFIYLPEYYRFKIKYDNTNYNLIKNMVMQLDIPFIDIYQELFAKEKNSLMLFPFQMFGHYNVKGYEKVSEIIYKFTKD